MAIEIKNRDDLIRAVSQLGFQVSVEQGVLDGLFATGAATTVDTLSGATSVGKAVMKATDAAAARTAIGAVALGTTASTAKAGNYVPTSAEVAAALKAKTQIAALTAVAVADATDQATAITLVNALKVSVNAIIAALKA